MKKSVKYIITAAADSFPVSLKTSSAQPQERVKPEPP